MKQIILIMFAAFFLTVVGNAHNNKKKKSEESTKVEAVADDAGHHEMSEHIETEHSAEMQNHHKSVMEKASFDDFPSLHPLVVHFPIVLLILALLSQFFGMFFLKNELSWATLIFVFLGFAGALIASRFVHPHTSALPEIPAWLLEQHEKYADLTLYASFGALVLKIISHFLLKRIQWIEILVLITLGLSAWFISSASHYGAQLTHIEGVGPQGHYLEMHSSDEGHTH